MDMKLNMSIIFKYKYRANNVELYLNSTYYHSLILDVDSTLSFHFNRVCLLYVEFNMKKSYIKESNVCKLQSLSVECEYTLHKQQRYYYQID